MTRPRRRVEKAVVAPWSSVVADFKSHQWRLHLECGHVVERRIRWKPDPRGRQRRGFAAMHHAPPLDRLPDEPKYARCEYCGAEGA